MNCRAHVPSRENSCNSSGAGQAVAMRELDSMLPDLLIFQDGPESQFLYKISRFLKGSNKIAESHFQSKDLLFKYNLIDWCMALCASLPITD